MNGFFGSAFRCFEEKNLQRTAERFATTVDVAQSENRPTNRGKRYMATKNTSRKRGGGNGYSAIPRDACIAGTEEE